MTTSGRILKVTPAVLLGMFVAAWIASDAFFLSISFPAREAVYEVSLERSTISLSRYRIENMSWLTSPLFGYGESHPAHASHPVFIVRLIGRALLDDFGNGYGYLEVPLLAVATLSLPLTIGPFLCFRFRLWHYLAYTALVSLQLAYYLRWQGDTFVD